jgi:putative FmdB family regulatory protein
MPFYEYQCQACSAQVEVLQKITDAPLKKCPECGKSRLTKLVSAPVFRLKGGGWYETDFKSDNDRKRNLVESDAGESKPDAAADAKSDAKSEAKVEAKSEAKAESRADAKPAPAKESGTASKSASKPAAKPVARRTTKAAPAKSGARAKSRR